MSFMENMSLSTHVKILKYNDRHSFPSPHGISCWGVISDTGITFPVFRVGTPKLLRVYFPQPGTTNLHSSDCSSSIPR